MLLHRERFDTLYRKQVRLVFAVVLAQGLDTAAAEDAVQETFVRAWRHHVLVLELPLPAQRAWLMTTARNVASTVRRRTPPVGEANAEIGTAPESDSSALRIDVAQALSHLSEEDRAIVLLRYFQGCCSREIGETLDMPEGTVRRRLATCRQRLATDLAAWQGRTSDG